MSSRPANLVKSRRKRRARPEELIQRACVEVMVRSVPEPPEGPFWTAINPVPAKSKAVAGISKAMGLRAGVLDFWLLWHGLTIVIEFKDPAKGRVSDDQEDRIDELEAHGAIVHVCTSMDQFIQLLHRHNIPCRAQPISGGV